MPQFIYHATHKYHLGINATQAMQYKMHTNCPNKILYYSHKFTDISK